MTVQKNCECPICGSERFDESLEVLDLVCNECGFVIHADIDSEVMVWNTSRRESQDRCSKDWLEVCRVRNATEKRVAQAFDVLEDLAAYLDISRKMRQNTADLYCESIKAKTTDGRETASIIAACLRLTSVQVNDPIPPERLVEHTDTDKRKFHLSLAAIQDDLEIQPQTPKPEAYVSFLGAVLDLDDTCTQDVKRLLKKVTNEPSLVGKTPVGIAAAGVYITQDDLTQAEIADAAGVSTETIRQRTRQLHDLMNNG